MKKIILLIAAALMMVGLAACEKAAETRTVENTQSAAEQPASQSGGASSAEFTGKVIETMDAGGYTYVHLDDGNEQIWAAGPVTPVQVGQEIHVAKNMPMKDFHSKALEKDFDMIYFVGSFAGHTAENPHGGMGGMGMAGSTEGQSTQGGMGAMGDGSSHTSVDMTEVAKVDKADFTVEEIFAKSADLGGKPVKIRGQVVKFTPNIMGTNWVHIQDGSKGDLTVTTSDVVAVGDIVLVEGSLTVNKDFGAGYKYDAIVEGAKVTKE